jgi:hypothetical protein
VEVAIVAGFSAKRYVYVNADHNIYAKMQFLMPAQ